MSRSRITVALALWLTFGAIPAEGVLALGNAPQGCAELYRDAANAFGSAENPGPLPVASCLAFAPNVCGPGLAACGVLAAGTYYVPGDLDLAGRLAVVGAGGFTLLVDGALTIRGTVEAANLARSSAVPVDGSNVVLVAHRIRVEGSGVVRAADGAEGRNVLARTPGLALRGIDGGRGGSVLLVAQDVDVAGSIMPGDGGRGGDALGLLGTDVRAGDGGSAGVGMLVTPAGARLLASGNGADGGAAYSLGDGAAMLSMNPCPGCAPTTNGDARCGGRWCLAPTHADAETCAACVLVGGPMAEDVTCAAERPFCVLSPPHVDTGPLGDGAGGVIGWALAMLPVVPDVPDDIGPSEGLCALVNPCTLPPLPSLPNPGDLELPPLPTLPRGPYCTMGMCFVLGELPTGGPEAPPVDGWAPEGPFCFHSAQWQVCILGNDPTQLPPVTPPPIHVPSTPCDALVGCQWWERITDAGVSGGGGVPITTACGGPARGADGVHGYGANGGQGGSARTEGCRVDGKDGEDGQSNVLILGCTNGEAGTDGQMGGTWRRGGRRPWRERL